MRFGYLDGDAVFFPGVEDDATREESVNEII
jgi:hypothetical protein